MGMPVINPGTTSREDSIGEIIESIAMEEMSIAHILNAESEKLQRIIDMADVSADDLLDANASVKATVDVIIQLEMALKAKLSLFTDTICKMD